MFGLRKTKSKDTAAGLCNNGIWTFPLDIFLPDISPSWTIPSALLHGVGHFPFRHYHPPIYNIKLSAVNVYKIDRGWSQEYGLVSSVQNIPSLVGRLGMDPRRESVRVRSMG